MIIGVQKKYWDGVQEEKENPFSYEVLTTVHLTKRVS